MDKSASPRQPGQREPKRPPLEARLAQYQLTKTELTLLRAMVEKSWDGLGQKVYASYDTLARWAKCCERTVRRLIEGYTDTRNGQHHRGLIERGILTRRDDGLYLNEAALPIDPRVKSYLDRSSRRRPAKQMELPGIAQATPCTPDTVSIDPKPSGDPKAFDPGAFAKALIEAIQHTPYELPATPGNIRAVTEAFVSDF